MSKYLLKVSGSNQIVNVVDWDGIGSLIAPSGYEFEPFVTESVDFINYFEEYTEETIEKLYGELEGKFTGELTGSITINGKTFQQIINETPFGEMRITDDFNINSVSSSNSFFVSGSTISLPKYNNTSETYELFFDSIIRNDVKNYKITFNKTSNPNEKLSYIISDTEIINDGGFEYIKLSVSNISGRDLVTTQSILNPTTPNDFFYRDEHSSHENYYIDFSLSTDLQVGKFYGDAELTGSFFGAFKGILDGTASNSVYAQTASFTDNASTIEVIVKSKNWTKPSWAKTIRVTCVGGGGGGGAALATEDSGPVTGGGGGGGGTITTGEFDADTLPNVINITIGAEGLGGTHDSVSLIGASNGGDSYFGRYLIARGGNAGFTGGAGMPYVYGGSSIANINYLNTGAGGGGAGTVDGYIGFPLFISDASMAPPLPLPTKYLSGEPGYLNSYYVVTPTPIPAVIAPTGGGGGLGYDVDNGGRQDGITEGGHISEYGLTNANNRFQSLSPWEYSSGSSVWFGGQLIDTGHYPAFNTEVGLGGRGGNPYTLEGPTEGTSFGGGGGGAFGGGIDGRYINGEINGTPYNFGANGARGVVVIISEA
jgi:hypothetical protein